MSRALIPASDDATLALEAEIDRIPSGQISKDLWVSSEKFSLPPHWKEWLGRLARIAGATRHPGRQQLRARGKLSSMIGCVSATPRHPPVPVPNLGACPSNRIFEASIL